MESPSSLLDSRVKKLTSPNDWTENGLQPTLILVGPADLKKVQAVKEMAVRLNWHILINENGLPFCLVQAQAGDETEGEEGLWYNSECSVAYFSYIQDV